MKSVNIAGKATLRMAEVAANALRALCFDDARNQDAAREAGALTLLTAQLDPAQKLQKAEERKARKENASQAAARAIHALARSNSTNQVLPKSKVLVHIICRIPCNAAVLPGPDLDCLGSVHL